MRKLATSGFKIVRKRHLFGSGRSPNNLYLPEREALRWVQKYIGKFGGDTSKVTMYVCALPTVRKLNEGGGVVFEARAIAPAPCRSRYT